MTVYTGENGNSGGQNTFTLISTIDWCLDSYLFSGTEETLQAVKVTKMMEEMSTNTSLLFPEESKRAFSRSTRSEILFPQGWTCRMDPGSAEIQLCGTHLCFQTQKPSFHAARGISFRPQRSRAHQCINYSHCTRTHGFPQQKQTAESRPKHLRYFALPLSVFFCFFLSYVHRQRDFYT